MLEVGEAQYVVFCISPFSSQILILFELQVVHCMKTHWGSSIVEWEKLSDADAQEARVLEAQSKNGHSQPAMAEWRCAHCQDISQEPERMTQADLYVHLRDE